MRLKGKTAFISGAGRNNGRAISLKLASEGANVILIAKSRSAELNAVAADCEKLGVGALPLLGDVTSESEAQRLVKAGLDKFGRIDTLVCVAAIRPLRDPWEYTAQEWLDVFALNVHSTLYLSKAIVPGMMERKSGTIIALGGSNMVTVSSGHGAAVVASKAALQGLIKSLAMALGPYNVRANMVAPAHIENKRENPEWYKDLDKNGRPAMEDGSGRAKMTPMRRKGQPGEVANCVAFLASDDSSYVTGDCIHCTGGWQI